MSLYVLNPGITPLGDFDVLDTDIATIEGGEVMVLDEVVGRVNTATERAAADVFDGYVADAVDTGTPTASRTVARIADENSETFNVFFLADDGIAGYGTLFGTVIGQTGGLVSGTALGPTTMAGSGKVTLWDKPGLYAVSVTTVDPTLDPRDGNLNDTPLPGTVLYRSTSGLLTTATGTSDKIGAFVELTNNGSLVTTPARLVGATESFDRVKFMYFGAYHNA